MDLVSKDRWVEKHAWPDAAIAELAGRQATMISHAQLRALGVSAPLIKHARQRGRLHPVHFGVFSLIAPAARPPRAAEHAALLACGSHAVISHRSAARLHGLQLEPRRGEVELTVVGGDRGRRRAQLRVHRTQLMHPGEVVRMQRLPVTSVARTAIDVAAELNGRGLELLVDRSLKRTSRAKLAEAVRRHRRRPGVSAIARLLDPARPSTDTESDAEERQLALLRRAGVPAPEVNGEIDCYRGDLVWREQRVVVEYDSDEFHSSDRERYDDARRHNDLTSWGWDVLHITRYELAHHPERILAWVAAALARAQVRRDRS